ncbi:hypothetical protein WME76_07750 [Sorangium sp. So ce119]
MRFMMVIHHDEAALAAAPQKELGAEYGSIEIRPIMDVQAGWTR